MVFVSHVTDAGIGKSRLLLEFRQRLAATNEELTWLEGRPKTKTPVRDLP
jgi:predicted ATP-dependent serine protease